MDIRKIRKITMAQIKQKKEHLRKKNGLTLERQKGEKRFQKGKDLNLERPKEEKILQIEKYLTLGRIERNIFSKKVRKKKKTDSRNV